MSVPSITMKTLQIGNDWPEERIGGLNRYFVELLRHLPQSGTKVRGLVVGPADLNERTNGIIRAFAARSDGILKRLLLARQAAAEEMRDGKVDLLVSHFALYAAPVSRPSNVPNVVHFHGPWAAESDVEGSPAFRLSVKQTLERSVYRRAHRLITLSRAFQKELISRYAVDEQLTRIVPGGIDTERFNTTLSRDEARTQLGWPIDRPIILIVRRLVRRMGLENLIDAVKILAPSQPDLLVLIGGKGPLASELEHRVKGASLQKQVRLLGGIEEADLPLTYRAADMTIVPTQALEGFGMITLESLSSGTPVLVTPVGGLPEILTPFAPECVLANTSHTEIAGVLGDILEGKRLLPSAEACRTYAMENFAWPIISSRVRAVYDEAQQ